MGIGQPKAPEEIAVIAADPAKFFHDEANPPTSYTMPSGHVFPRLPDESFWIVMGGVFVGK